MLLAVPCVLAQEAWIERYVEASTIEPEAAMQSLEALMVEHPYPERDLRTASGDRIDYLPYLQMARLQLATGAFSEAELSLDISEAFGLYEKSKPHRELYEELRSRIERQRKAVAVVAR